MKKNIKFSLLAIITSVFAGFFFLGLASSSFIDLNFFNNSFTSPFVSNNAKKRPLQQYSINNLQKREYTASPITIEKIFEENTNFTSYLFSYITTDKRMTGQINIPLIRAYGKKPKTILMIRGYLPAETYETGMGTKNAASVFARAEYITIAPDFFGYADSDNESEDVWEARFVKPVNVIELIESIKAANYIIGGEIELSEEQAVSIERLNGEKPSPLDGDELAIWAHSNGGQITLSVLEILGEPIPSTLWAPMVAPFPYSILYFGWDEADEGKEQRKWISMLEEDYDVLDFSITNHLEKLTGPIQIHHGSADNQVLTTWVESLVEKIKKPKPSPEMERESGSAPANQMGEVIYYSYPNTDHNLQPAWNTAIQRDLKFFEENL
ncbi:MAG: hypothetical protein ABFQ62_05340 [Patescibacteria group bacterium]